MYGGRSINKTNRLTGLVALMRPGSIRNLPKVLRTTSRCRRLSRTSAGAASILLPPCQPKKWKSGRQCRMMRRLMSRRICSVVFAVILSEYVRPTSGAGRSSDGLKRTRLWRSNGMRTSCRARLGGWRPSTCTPVISQAQQKVAERQVLIDSGLQIQAKLDDYHIVC